MKSRIRSRKKRDNGGFPCCANSCSNLCNISTLSSSCEIVSPFGFGIPNSFSIFAPATFVEEAGVSYLLYFFSKKKDFTTRLTFGLASSFLFFGSIALLFLLGAGKFPFQEEPKRYQSEAFRPKRTLTTLSQYLSLSTNSTYQILLFIDLLIYLFIYNTYK